MSDKESTSASSAGAPARRVQTAALIELVHARPCLWDRAAPGYRLRVEKDRAWRDVHRALDPTYDVMTREQRREFGLIISRKWSNIRDSYKKYLNGTSAHRVNSSRPYLYANQLTFLDSVYDGNHKGKPFLGKREHDHDPPEQEWLSEVFVDMDETREEQSPEPKRMRVDYPRAKEGGEMEENIVSVLVNLIEKEEDEDRAFFKSITPTVKSLSEGDKFLFRIRVMKLLDSLKRKDNLVPAKTEKLSRDSDSD